MSSNKTDAIRILAELAKIAHSGGLYPGIFERETAKSRSNHQSLGNGFELRLIVMKDKDGNEVENRENYSHLYRKGVQIGSKIFRRGGLGGDFKDGYCQLIHYVQKEPHTEKRHGFDFGIHVIINESGETVLSGTGISSYPYHCGGNLGKLKDCYYNLLTGEPIIECSSSDHIDGKNYLMVSHKYEWYSKTVKMPLGIYRINKSTCEIEKIDEI